MADKTDLINMGMDSEAEKIIRKARWERKKGKKSKEKNERKRNKPYNRNKERLTY